MVHSRQSSQGFTVDTEFAREISLRIGGGGTLRGGGANEIQAGVAHDVQISLPGFDLTHRNLIAIPLKMLEPTVGHEVDGIIGSRLFDDFVVVEDYEHARVSIQTPQEFRPAGNQRPVPVVLDSHGFQFIDATITLPGAEPITASLLIDGGANTFADLYKTFSDAHRIPPAAMKLLDDPGTSTGGTTESRDGRADRISIGSFSVLNPPITFAQDTEGLMAADYAGLIGAEFLERFTVVFDNPDKRLFLAPNRHFEEIPEYDQSGLHIRAEGPGFHKFVVGRIVSLSPALEAGIQAGDVIESVDNKSADQMNLTELRKLLRRPNAHCLVGIVRGTDHLRIALTLRPLL